MAPRRPWLVSLPPQRLPLTRARPAQQRQSSSSSTPPSSRSREQQPDPYQLLSTPTWSIRTLLPSTEEPPSQASSSPNKTTGEQEEDRINLAHLLRLSALPQPASAQETSRMLATLRAQLKFVRDIQQVNTDGVAPLHSIRDETAEGRREATIDLSTPQIQEALAREEQYGRWKRPRRRKSGGSNGDALIVKEQEQEGWDVLGSAAKKVGRYFVVRSGKKIEGAGDG